MGENLAMKSHAPSYFSVWDLHAYYGESYIVQGISFNVHEGEILALLGRNGAGKTSTLRTIARMGDPQLKQGEIWLDHQHLHTMSSHEAAISGVALVPEDRRIIPGLTVEENIQLAQIVEPIGWSLERIYDLFPRLGERRKQEGVTLSGGEQQRVAIARALLNTPSIIIADEPTGNLDPQTSLEIMEVFRKLHLQGMTVLMATHDYNMIVKFPGKILRCDEGTVYEVVQKKEG